MNLEFIASLFLRMKHYVFFYRVERPRAPHLQCFMLFLRHLVHEQQAHLNNTSDICCCWSNSTKVCCSDSILTHISQVLLRVSAHPNYVFALSISTHSNYYVSCGMGQHLSSLVVVCVVVVVLPCPAKFHICNYGSMPIQILLLWLWISTHPGSTSRTVGQPL